MSDDTMRHWLRLARTENVGPVTFRQLIARYGSPQRALEALPELAARGGMKRSLKAPSLAEIDAEMADLKKRGATLLTWESQGYPTPLKSLPDAPPVLVIRGKPELLTKPAIAFVGARNASLNGRRLAEKLAREVGEAGFVVVSGLASGIDASAHWGALETGTVGVIAAGIESVYPTENADLYQKMAEKGVIITEMPVGTPIKPTLFPRRNRIASGLSLGVVVVEATLRSGSLITARLASEQGREVMAVPGSPLDPRSAGGNRLIKQGATLIETAADIIEAIEAQTEPSLSLGLEDTEAHNSFELNSTSVDALLSPEETQVKVWDALTTSATPINDVVRASGLPAPTVAAVLLELELAGRLVRGAGGQVARLGL